MKKNQVDRFREAITAGVNWIRGLDAPPLRQSLPYCATSDSADAFLIAAWGIYWGRGEIEAIRRSRGHSWRVIFKNSLELAVSVSNPYDHREGIQII